MLLVGLDRLSLCGAEIRVGPGPGRRPRRGIIGLAGGPLGAKIVVDWFGHVALNGQTAATLFGGRGKIDQDSYCKL